MAAGRFRGPPAVRRAGVVCLLGLAGLLSGCTGDPEPAAPGPADRSPLEEFLGLDPPRGQAGPPQLTEPERQQQYAVEELVAECMAGHGFEYRPVPPEQRLAGTFAGAYALEPAEFAQRYGYGVTTLRGAAGGEPPADPNQEIRDRLGPERLRDYERAMWGAGTDPGCQQRAGTAVYGDQTGRDAGFARFQELLDQIGELYRQIEADPRLAQASADWSACMAGAGYPGFADPADARQSVFDRLGQVQRAGQPSPDPAELAGIGDYERALAPVDLACREEHVDRPRWQVTVERESEFIAAHRAELEAYRDWLAQTREPPG